MRDASQTRLVSQGAHRAAKCRTSRGLIVTMVFLVTAASGSALLNSAKKHHMDDVAFLHVPGVGTA